MGRTKTPIQGEGPVPTFAVELRALRAAAGNPTYRTMAKTAKFSHNALSEADRGIKLPSWDRVKAYLIGCGVTTPEDIEQWHQRWESTRTALKLREAMLPKPPRQRTARVPSSVGAMTPRLSAEIDFTRMSTMQDLVGGLNDLILGQSLDLTAIARAGAQVNSSTAEQLVAHPWLALADAMTQEILTGRGRPTLESIIRIVTACGGNRADIRLWAEQWRCLDIRERAAQEKLDRLRKEATTEQAELSSQQPPAPSAAERTDRHVAAAQPIPVVSARVPRGHQPQRQEAVEAATSQPLTNPVASVATRHRRRPGWMFWLAFVAGVAVAVWILSLLYH